MYECDRRSIMNFNYCVSGDSYMIKNQFPIGIYAADLFEIIRLIDTKKKKKKETNYE